MSDEPINHYIEFNHVYKTFDRPILVDVNFHLDAGNVTASLLMFHVGRFELQVFTICEVSKFI